MEEKVLKRVIKKPVEKTEDNNGGSNTFFKVLNVLIFVMVFVIFIRGFGIKSTIQDESAIIQQSMKELKTELGMDRQIDKNEILSAFALYSRLDAAALKEREEFHKQQQAKFENMANQYNQGLKDLSKQIKTKKDSIK